MAQILPPSQQVPPLFHPSRLTKVRLATARTRILHSSNNNVTNTVVILPATSVGDLNLTTTVWAWGFVVLPVVGQGYDERAVLRFGDR